MGDLVVGDFESEAQRLFLRHEPEQADIALVFGHSDPLTAAPRVRHAVKLSREGVVPRLLLSGGPVSGAVSEAERMAAVCREAGVPPEALLLEGEFRNTFQNAARSLALLTGEALLGDGGTVLLVSCPWHMRRAYLTTREAFPPSVRLLCCPHGECCTESSWRDSSECRARVASELALLSRFVRAGILTAEGA